MQTTTYPVSSSYLQAHTANKIIVDNIEFVAAKKQLPFGNNFVQLSTEIVQYEGQDEIRAIVQCTSNSKEPGREYVCNYSLTGKLLGCNTIN